MSEIQIGVSCLLVEQVRYDGGHKRNAFLLDELASNVRFVPVRPELAIGLGAPRETTRLVRHGDGVRLLGSAGVDHTAAMRRWADTLMGELCRQERAGFVLNKRSPSCGLERVGVWDESAQRPSRPERGVFAQALVDATPGLAIEEESRAGVRRHQRRPRPSERPTTAGAASSALRTAASSEVSRPPRAEEWLPPPTTRAARPPTARAGTRAPQSDGSIIRHEASKRCLT
jgi:uncharacterized protein YbbK (DUF523 family)